MRYPVRRDHLGARLQYNVLPHLLPLLLVGAVGLAVAGVAVQFLAWLVEYLQPGAPAMAAVQWAARHGTLTAGIGAMAAMVLLGLLVFTDPLPRAGRRQDPVGRDGTQ